MTILWSVDLEPFPVSDHGGLRSIAGIIAGLLLGAFIWIARQGVGDAPSAREITPQSPEPSKEIILQGPDGEMVIRAVVIDSASSGSPAAFPNDPGARHLADPLSDALYLQAYIEATSLEERIAAVDAIFAGPAGVAMDLSVLLTALENSTPREDVGIIAGVVGTAIATRRWRVFDEGDETGVAEGVALFRSPDLGRLAIVALGAALRTASLKGFAAAEGIEEEYVAIFASHTDPWVRGCVLSFLPSRRDPRAFLDAVLLLLDEPRSESLESLEIIAVRELKQQWSMTPDRKPEIVGVVERLRSGATSQRSRDQSSSLLDLMAQHETPPGLRRTKSE